MQRLVRLLSFNSYYFLANGLGLALAILVLRDGLTTLDVLIVAVYVIGAGLFARRLRAPRPQPAQFTDLASFNQALRDPRPTMLAFYSDNCAICMTTLPDVQRLEQEVGRQLQILRINVGGPLGLQIADRYAVRLTPTFLLLTSAGLKDEAFTLFLDRPRIRYWLDQQTIAPLSSPSSSKPV